MTVADRTDPPATPAAPNPAARPSGWPYAVGAYAVWGFFPLYFRALRQVPPLEVLAHRVLWSALLLTVWLGAIGRWSLVREALGPRTRWTVVASTLLIAINWLVYIFAVQTGRVLEASLGYFINPLVSVLLGVFFLREGVRPRQQLAIALAAVGVGVLIVRLGGFPWLPLCLAASFGLYGLCRKQARVDPTAGLLAETALLTPLALVVLLASVARSGWQWQSPLDQTLLLVAAGPITAVPLVWFAVGVQRLPLSTVGLLQYLTPSTQFLLAVWIFREPFRLAHGVAFGFIWLALVIYTVDTFAARASAVSSTRR